MPDDHIDQVIIMHLYIHLQLLAHPVPRYQVHLQAFWFEYQPSFQVLVGASH